MNETTLTVVIQLISSRSCRPAIVIPFLLLRVCIPFVFIADDAGASGEKFILNREGSIPGVEVDEC
jgi:hypothetical protein